jgi:polar amino acid transport system substrate-binding protein
MNKKITLTLAILLAIAMTFAAAACGNKSDDAPADKTADTPADTSLEDIKAAGEIVLGCDDAFPPMGFDDNGEIVGFDIDLAEAVAGKLGVSLVVKPIDWNAKELELSSKNIDVIWNGYSITADRVDKVTFTKPYLNNAQMLVVRADSSVKSKSDLSGKIVGAQIDSAAESLITADTAFNDSLKELRVYDDYQAALNDLKASDRIDAVAVDKILIEYIMKQSPDTFRILDESLGDEYFGIGCRLGETSLADAIDAALEELKAEGKTAEISEKWFGGGQDIVITDVPRLTAADF